MNPFVIGGALALGKLQEEQAQKEAERRERAKLFASRAREHGYPAMAYEAVGARQDIDAIEGPNYLGMLMDAEDKKKARGEGGELGGRDYFRMFMG